MIFSEHTDYYDVLQIPPNADEQTIKSAFRKQARMWHPDVSAHKDEATEKFKIINEAYMVLSNTDKRRSYDSFRIARWGFTGSPNHASQSKKPPEREQPAQSDPPKDRSSQSNQKEPPNSERKAPPNASDSTRQEPPSPKKEPPNNNEIPLPSGLDFLKMAGLENRFYSYVLTRTQTNYASEKIIPLLTLILKGPEKWISQDTWTNPNKTIENNAVIGELWTFVSKLIESTYLEGKTQKILYQNSLFTRILCECCRTINSNFPDFESPIVIEQSITSVTFIFRSHLTNSKLKENPTVGDPPWESARKQYVTKRNQAGASIYDIRKAQLDLYSSAGLLTDSMGLLQPFSRWLRTRDCHELSSEVYNQLAVTIQKCLNFFQFPMEDGPNARIHTSVRDFKVFKDYFDAQFNNLSKVTGRSGPLFQACNKIHTALEETMQSEFTVYTILLNEGRNPTKFEAVLSYFEVLMYMRVPLRAIHWAEEEIDPEVSEANFKNWKEIYDFFKQIQHVPKMSEKPSKDLLPSVKVVFSKLPDLFGLRFLYMYYHLKATNMIDSYRRYLNDPTFSENKVFWEAFETSLKQEQPSELQDTVLKKLRLFCKYAAPEKSPATTRAESIGNNISHAFSGK